MKTCWLTGFPDIWDFFFIRSMEHSTILRVKSTNSSTLTQASMPIIVLMLLCWHKFYPLTLHIRLSERNDPYRTSRPVKASKPTRIILPENHWWLPLDQPVHSFLPPPGCRWPVHAFRCLNIALKMGKYKTYWYKLVLWPEWPSAISPSPCWLEEETDLPTFPLGSTVHQ